MSGRSRRSDHRGITLVELLTAMALSALVLGYVTRTIVHAISVQRNQTAQVAALNAGKLAFERVTRDLRGADPLRVTAVDRVRLDLRGDGGTVRTVTYERDGNRLVATDAGTGRTSTLVGDLAAGQPLFRFHLADGSSVTGVGTLDAGAVRAVTVHLQVEPRGAGRVIDLENRVLVRNAGR